MGVPQFHHHLCCPWLTHIQGEPQSQSCCTPVLSCSCVGYQACQETAALPSRFLLSASDPCCPPPPQFPPLLGSRQDKGGTCTQAAPALLQLWAAGSSCMWSPSWLETVQWHTGSSFQCLLPAGREHLREKDGQGVGTGGRNLDTTATVAVPGKVQLPGQSLPASHGCSRARAPLRFTNHWIIQGQWWQKAKSLHPAQLTSVPCQPRGSSHSSPPSPYDLRVLYPLVNPGSVHVCTYLT